MNPNSADNQEKRREWAQEHVHASASRLIRHLAEETGTDYWDEPWFVSLFMTPCEDEDELDEDGDPIYIEPLEFYVVSHYLAHHLKKRGEAVSDMYGINIWGRAASGQAAYMDNVMEDIWVSYVTP